MGRNKGLAGFVIESIRNINTVGTVTRSSRFLCRAMIKPVDFTTAKVLVELGAGDGVVTHHILEAMSDDCKLMIFEVNPKFCRALNEIQDDRLIVVSDSAERLEHYLNLHDLDKPDYIISALPFTILPEELSYRILRECKKCLKKTGKYIQIHYSLLPLKMYKNVFGAVQKERVVINIPPAWVFICRNDDK